VRVIKNIILVVINCCLLVSGQVLWKTGLKQVKLNTIKDYIMLLFNPNVFGGLVIYVIATFLWFYILSKNDLSKIYPLQSISYIIAMFAGYLFLHEHISQNSIVGTLVICLGIFIIFR
jgi:drug/metabolite transporter (DMT)-like permease